jgi:carbonic anhydrase
MKPGIAILFLSCIVVFYAACSTDHTAVSHPAASPIEQLLEGNIRFAGNHSVHPHESRERMEDISAGQHPIAAIVCCSDSRVPPEIIFDQGLGDLFVIRTAGNLMGGLEIGSIEYAVEHLGVKQVLVMGHKECGALKAFTEGQEVPGHIRDIVDSIKMEQEIRQIPRGDKNRLDVCIRANILHGIHQLQSQSSIIAEKIKTKELQVFGAIYDLEKGLVQLVSE